MSSRSLIVLMALSFVGLLGLAWSLYPFLMALVLPDGVTTVATSLSEATQHRLFSVLPIAALGPLLLSGARFIAGPAFRPLRLGFFAFLLGCVGVVTAALWTVLSATRYPNHLLDGDLPVALPVAAVPLYQPGLAACGGVALAALFAALLKYRRK